MDADICEEDTNAILLNKRMKKKTNYKKEKRLEDNYYEFSVLEEFVEYENFTNSKDLADLASEKIESYLASFNSKLQFEEDKSKVKAYSKINLPK
ncbi:hypothetical protein TNCV_3763321 [Trichonephila clavipes]|uniref:Uncharacterized protein n=1 Tax=Trichonephila clavipes TaxID=2585209 RepID=A0A8X6VV50_TRICX|nr:hypothetical protein TNCV_3763321 [Trichonephila clavipes]